MAYDLLVIGGGPGGYHAAEKAALAGLKTMLATDGPVGGVCLNEGCIPTKALLYSAKVYEAAKGSAKYGVRVGGAELDHGAVIERKRKVVSALTGGVTRRLRKAGVTVAQGGAVIRGKAGGAFRAEVGGEAVEASSLIIATGSSPIMPRIEGLDRALGTGFAMTSSGMLESAAVPRRLVVVGGGVIGLEMASYYNSAGSEVFVVEALDHIAGFTDREISSMLMAEYERKGVRFLLKGTVTALGDGMVRYGLDGGAYELNADTVLMSVGRRPNVAGLGLESIGVETKGGRIPTDGRMRTNVSGAYAVGDVNGESMLAHTAYVEAEVAVDNILGVRRSVRYGAIPSVIYTNPEVAGCGETEESAAGKGMAVEVRKKPLAYNGRYMAESEGDPGLCKILLEKGTGRIVGVHMMGPYASEVIFGASAFMEMEMTGADVAGMVFPHPTVSEMIKETLER
ncbi:MAG: dihydrolipoyl dehydrogenase [Oscillospiraceae bacterium]|nr:dihydrolipoyl dehydrogenase [Oscillospiraceae bacterium]